MCNYRSVFDDSDLAANTEQAGFIFNKFMKSGSAESVNLPAKIYDQIKDDIDKNIISIDLFDHAQRNMYNLMRRDSYPRFKSGKLYKEFQDLGAKTHEVDVSLFITAINFCRIINGIIAGTIQICPLLLISALLYFTVLIRVYHCHIITILSLLFLQPSYVTNITMLESMAAAVGF